MGGLQVPGAALGAAFDVLFVSVIDAGQRLASFRSDLNRLKSTLISIKPVFEDIDSLNRIMDRPEEEMRTFVVRLARGEELVRRCSEVECWNLLTRLYYSIKLRGLETSILSFFQVNVAALQLREIKRVSVVVSNLEEKVNEIVEVIKGISHYEAVASGSKEGGHLEIID